tara:strand:- start:128 stop:316 length:189 start_codon:yes stop_codon:yes gene_type:complete
MILSEQMYKDYMGALSDLRKANQQIEIAIQGLEAIMQSGQINIADKTLEAIKEVEETGDVSL